MLDESFLSGLEERVGADSLLQPEDLAGRDPGIDPENLGAGFAVLPGTVSEVAEVLVFCNARGVSVVPHGGLTSLSGAAISSPGQLIISTARLNRSIEVDAAGGVAVVDAGVTLEALDKIAAEHNLSVGIDIGARGTATIGGMLATNAGGGEAFQYGVMRHRVLGLEAVLPDGTLMTDMKRVSKANEGLDVKQLFVGAEGTLGIITRASLKLEPRKGAALTAMVATASAGEAVALFRQLRQSAVLDLRYAEIMWKAHVETSAHDLGLTSLVSFADGAVYTLFELCPREQTDDGIDTLVEVLVDLDATDALIAQSEREREEMWCIREDSWAVLRQFPHGLWYDVSVPLSLLDEYVKDVEARIHAVDPKLRVFTMGHLGDGNLHFTVSKGEVIDHLNEDIAAAIYDGLHEMGGSFSAEHGIGTEKKHALAERCDPGKRAVMMAIKQALDPNGIMNPGKIYPMV